MQVYKLELESLSDEFKFLLDIISGSKPIPKGIQGFDWNHFLKLIIHHRVFPGLISKVKQEDYTNIFPNYVVQKLQNWNQKNVFDMLHLTAELELINSLFYKHKIDSLFLKGPFLGNILYGDLSLRTSGDLDLLVSIDDLNKVDSMLIKEGYVKDNYIKSILNDWKWRHHHFTYFNSIKNIKIEVHWRLNPGPSKEPSFQELWKRKQSLYYSDIPINILGYEDLFFFLVTHGSRHGWSRIRWLIDLDRLMLKELDWVKISEQFRLYSNTAILGQALILSNQLLKTDITRANIYCKFKKNSSRLSQDTFYYFKNMINLHNSPSKETSNYHKKYLISIMSLRQKVLFYLSLLFPYPEDAELLSLPKKLHILYFPLRPFIWVYKKYKNLQVQGVGE